MSSRNRIATCAVICCLLLAMVATVAIAAPFKIYDRGAGGAESANVQYGNVYDGMFYGGQYTRVAVEAWGDLPNDTIWPVTGGAMGFQFGTPEGFTPNPSIANPVNGWNNNPVGNVGKGAFKADGYLYGIQGAPSGQATVIHGIWQAADWACTGGLNKVDLPSDQGIETACSDGGTTVWAVSYTTGCRQNIYKYHIDSHSGGTYGGGSFSLVNGWPAAIPCSGPSVYLRGISYDAASGNIYVVDNGVASATPGKVWQVNATTGSVTEVCTGNTNTSGSRYNHAVRVGDQLFVLRLDGTLCRYDFVGGVCPATPTTTFAMGANSYSIGFKAVDGVAKYMWLPNSPAHMTFWDLYPWDGTPRNISDAVNWKSGYPIYANAVVTAIGPGTGFWVENQERTMGAFVAWTGTAPAIGKIVTIKAQGSKNASGEKIATAIDNTTAVTVGATADPVVGPLFVTNKSMDLTNDQLLVKVCGKVTGIDMGSGVFTIDDGSGVGVAVQKADGTDMLAVTNYQELVMTSTPAYAVVTGIAQIGAGGARTIAAVNDASIVITAL